jgi:hypothetical protein
MVLCNCDFVHAKSKSKCIDQNYLTILRNQQLSYYLAPKFLHRMTLSRVTMTNGTTKCVQIDKFTVMIVINLVTPKVGAEFELSKP